MAELRDVVLLACGSFNPITNLHLRMFGMYNFFLLALLSFFYYFFENNLALNVNVSIVSCLLLALKLDHLNTID